MKDVPAKKTQKRVTLITAGAFHFFHDGIADGLAVFLPLWQAAFGLSLTHVGLLVTCFEGVTGFFQIPAGFLGERFGERALLVVGTLITAISFVCLGFVEGLVPLVFLFIQKGIAAESVGFALSLLLMGGAVGKFICGALAEQIGINATVVITECITGLGILFLTVLPFPHAYFFLPFLGAALNGTSSVLYGTVADFVNPHRVARAFGLFYTFVIAAAALAPPIMGRASDILGLDNSVRLIGWIALSTVPMAGVLSWQMPNSPPTRHSRQ